MHAIALRRGSPGHSWAESDITRIWPDYNRARDVLSKSLTLRGYINYEFAAEHYLAFLHTVGAAVANGRILYREDIADGLENAPAAFIGMLEGRNFGKTLVRVAPQGDIPRSSHWHSAGEA